MANYAIIRMEKFKISDVQGIQKHNQRQGKIKSNPDIDYERSHLNYDLLNREYLQYERRIKDEISERVKRKPRANSVVLSEFLVTASPEYMQSLTKDEQKRYFERSLDFIKERYGERNTLYAVVHQDEANPHMHVGVLPITEDGRLSAKDIYNRTELRQLQQDFPDELQRQGFEVERGKEGSKEKHLHPNEYKEKQDLEREIAFLEKNLEQKKNQLLAISGNVPEKNVSLKPKRKEIKTLVKPKLIGKPEIIEKETGNYVFSPKQLEKLENVVTAAVTIKRDYERLQSTDLVEENTKLHKELFQQRKENHKLTRENKELRSENMGLKRHISDLQREIGFLYQNTKEFLKERTESVRAFKNVFKDFIGDLRKKITGSEFERLYKRERAQECDRGMER
ncbi:plasmid recombination protein (plasmid) [Bacillus badius]|uniref:MobV family relaxase n=1 Tax=Bacillus badius TaxID=1455 RepID=UPI001CBAF75A|nr:MobV family relaxase [Bacillus badius]UAT33115.1 plasmid recombination protein [Bacillus badius]